MLCFLGGFGDDLLGGFLLHAYLFVAALLLD